MALKTQKKVNTLSDKLKIERCNPKSIVIPSDIINAAPKKGKIIETAIKKYGPGILTKLRRDEDKEKDVKKLIEAISNPYKTLCFYENYFNGASNFQKIDQIFEKVRKEIEKAANRSNKFKNAFEKEKIKYDKNDLQQKTYNENPDNNDDTAFEMLEMKDGTKVQSFANYCSHIVNVGFNTYEKAHDQFKEIKNDLAKTLTENNSKYYEGLKNKCSKLTNVFKENVIPISNQIEELINMANTKKSILQLKLFKASHSKFLPDLITEKAKLDNTIQQINNTINLLTSNKYGSYSDDILKVNDNIDDLYYSTKNLYNKLSLNTIDYNKIQKELNEIIEKTQKINNEITNTSNNLNNKLEKSIQEKGKNFKQISNTLDKKIIQLMNSSIDTNKQIKTVIHEIKKFQESYSAKGWAKWLAKGGIKLLFGGLRKLNDIILNLTRYMEVADMFFPEDEPEPK